MAMVSRGSTAGRTSDAPGQSLMLTSMSRVYLLEGLFTILFAGVVFLVLPDYPKSKRSAKWLTPREQEYIEMRLTENAPRTEDPAFSKKEVLASLKNPRTYAFCLSQILMNLGGYGLQWQLPTVTTGLGFAGLPRNQLLNIPPAAASVLSIIFAGWFLSRAYMTRPAFIMIICAGALAFFLVLVTDVSRTATYIACIFGTMFYSVYFIPFWACKLTAESSSQPVLTSYRALGNSRRLNRHGVHTRIPILHRSSWWGCWTTVVQTKICTQRIQGFLWHLCRSYWWELACQCLDMVSHSEERERRSPGAKTQDQSQRGGWRLGWRGREASEWPASVKGNGILHA